MCTMKKYYKYNNIQKNKKNKNKNKKQQQRNSFSHCLQQTNSVPQRLTDTQAYSTERRCGRGVF